MNNWGEIAPLGLPYTRIATRLFLSGKSSTAKWKSKIMRAWQKKAENESRRRFDFDEVSIAVLVKIVGSRYSRLKDISSHLDKQRTFSLFRLSVKFLLFSVARSPGGGSRALPASAFNFKKELSFSLPRCDRKGRRVSDWERGGKRRIRRCCFFFFFFYFLLSLQSRIKKSVGRFPFTFSGASREKEIVIVNSFGDERFRTFVSCSCPFSFFTEVGLTLLPTYRSVGVPVAESEAESLAFLAGTTFFFAPPAAAFSATKLEDMRRNGHFLLVVELATAAR